MSKFVLVRMFCNTILAVRRECLRKLGLSLVSAVVVIANPCLGLTETYITPKTTLQSSPPLAGAQPPPHSQVTKEHPSNELIRKLERKTAFDDALDLIMPITPEELGVAQERQAALTQAATPKPAMMHTETRQIHITPGKAPQVVHLTYGYTSTLVFQDMTGRPWPVLAMVVGNPQAFAALQPKIQRLEAPKGGVVDSQASDNVNSHIINLVPLSPYASSNVALTLEDCPYPIILHLLTTSPTDPRRLSDALVVFRLDQAGPNAALPNLGPSLQAATVSEETLGFIHAVPPGSAQRLKLEPEVSNVKLWRYQGKLYLRTNHALIWPAWTQVAAGEDMRVYVLPKTRSLVLSVAGAYTKIKVPGGQDE